MSARAEILARIRTRLARGRPEIEQVARARVQLDPRPIPKRSRLPPEEQLSLFIERCEMRYATTARVRLNTEIPAAVAAYQKSLGPDSSIALSPTPWLKELPWTESGLSASTPATAQDLRLCVSPAYAGIAESGTLVFCSGPDSQMWNNFTTDNLVAIIAEHDLVGTMEEVFARGRQGYGTGTMPRSLTLVSSVSMTGDIGQQLVNGAHGPRRLHIVIVAA